MIAEPGADAAPPSSPTPPPAPRSWRRLGIVGGVGVVLFFGGLWFLQRNIESTDDAFIDADIVEISPHVGGYVTAVAVRDNQWVEAGQLLGQISPHDYELRVQQAAAALASATARHGAERQDLAVVTTTTEALIRQGQRAVEAALASQQQVVAEGQVAAAQAQMSARDVVRYQALYDKQEISRQRLDQVMTADRAAQAQWMAAQRAVEAASAHVGEVRERLAEARSGPRQVALKEAQAVSGQASVAEAQATLAQAQLDLSYTRLVAPVAGRVTRKNIFQGQLLQPGTVAMAIVYGAPWVVANFKETQLREMRRGQKVDIKVDAYPDRVLHGHVDSFQAGTGARFSLLPPENATGNYVKVVQRVPVKIVLDEPPEQLRQLAPGLSVTPRVHLDTALSGP